jgi:hypothetical protein
VVAISFTTGDLRVFCTDLCQGGGHFARIGGTGRNYVADVHAEFHATVYGFLQQVITAKV